MMRRILFAVALATFYACLALAVGVVAHRLYAQSPTGQNFADDEAPGVQPDGVTQFFKMQHVPVVSSVKVYRNGIRVTRGLDFAVYPGGAFPRVGFFACCIPQAGDILRFDYRY